MAEIRELISHKEICELGIPHSSFNCGRVRKKNQPNPQPFLYEIE
jgi:hypothetical protein